MCFLGLAAADPALAYALRLATHELALVLSAYNHALDKTVESEPFFASYRLYTKCPTALAQALRVFVFMAVVKNF